MSGRSQREALDNAAVNSYHVTCQAHIETARNASGEKSARTEVAEVGAFLVDKK